MVFPAHKRVVYETNTLAEVICQLRYSPILAIEAEPPAGFQEAIRREYPNLKENRGIELGTEFPAEMAAFVQSQFPAARTYDFLTRDENWKVGLTKEFLALSTKTYLRWEDFKSHLNGPFEALREIYRPDSFTRVGLRYKNVVRRSKVGLQDCSWRELLRPEVLGELGDPHVADRISKATREYLLEASDGTQVRVKHGLGRIKENEEVVYVIDADYFVEGTTELTDAISRLDSFNRESGRFFRWCITDKLHDALGPRDIA